MMRLASMLAVAVVLLPSVVLAAAPHPTPSVVPATATTQPRAGTLTLVPSSYQLTTADNLGTGPPITVLGRDLPPHITIGVELDHADGSYYRMLTPAIGQPQTDARGQFSWQGTMGTGLPASTYLITVHQEGNLFGGNGPRLAQAALSVQEPPSSGLFAGVWSNAVQTVAAWWAGLMQEGKDGVLSQVLGVVLYGDDPTTHHVPAIVGLMATLAAIGQGAIKVLVSVRVLTIALGLLRRAQGWGPWLTLALELMGVLVAVAALTSIEHAVWGWVQRFVTGTDAHALDPLVAAVKNATTVDMTTIDLSHVLAWVLLLVLGAVFVIIELTRLGGYALLEVLYIMGPLVVVLLLVKETRGVALTWLRSILAITFWPILYLLFIEGGVALVFSFSGGDAAVFGNPLVKVGLGVMLVMALLMVPEMAGRLMSEMVAGAGSYINARRTPALHVAGVVQKRLRGLLPF